MLHLGNGRYLLKTARGFLFIRKLHVRLWEVTSLGKDSAAALKYAVGMVENTIFWNAPVERYDITFTVLRHKLARLEKVV